MTHCVLSFQFICAHFRCTKNNSKSFQCKSVLTTFFWNRFNISISESFFSLLVFKCYIIQNSRANQTKQNKTNQIKSKQNKLNAVESARVETIRGKQSFLLLLLLLNQLHYILKIKLNAGRMQYSVFYGYCDCHENSFWKNHSEMQITIVEFKC